MALKNIWTDKVDGVDDVLAEDINAIAHQAIENADAIADSENTLDVIIAEQGRIIFLADGTSEEGFYEITEEEYQKKLAEEQNDI